MNNTKAYAIVNEKVGQVFDWLEEKIKALVAPKVYEKIQGFFRYMRSHQIQRLVLSGFVIFFVGVKTLSWIFTPSVEDLTQQAIREAQERSEIQQREHLAKIEQSRKDLAAKKAKASAEPKIKKTAEKKKSHLETGGGYSALPRTELDSLHMQTVYVAVPAPMTGIGKQRLPDEYLVSGEPVTLYKDYINGWVKIKNQDGITAKIQLTNLSKTPLKYNLLEVENAEQLIQDILVDAYDLPKYINEIYDIAHSDNGSVEYEMRASMSSYLKHATALTRLLVNGAGRGPEMLLKNKKNLWLTKSPDKRLLAWYAQGIKEKALKKRLKAASTSLKNIQYAYKYQRAADQLTREKEEKPWRKGLDHLDESSLASIDAEKIADYDQRIAGERAKSERFFKSAEETKNDIQS